MNPVFRYLFILLATFSLALPAYGYDLRIHDAPNWVNDGSIFTSVKGERYFYGVGSSPVVGEAALQKAISKSRAESQLKRLITLWMDTAAESYLSSGKSSDEKAVKTQLKNIQKQVMEKAELAARWRDPRTGSLYSLSLLDMKTLKAVISESQEIDASLQKHLRILGNTIFAKAKKQHKKQW